MDILLSAWTALKLWGQEIVVDYGLVGLFFLSFTEHFIQPLPIDPFLAGATALGFSPLHAVVVVSLSGILGACVGYFLGHYLGEPVVKKLFGKKVFHEGELLFKKYGVWTVVIAAFTPFPFKLVTWLAGMFEMRFSVFVLAVALGRIPRFFLVAYGGLYLGNLF